ncbi:unnamed protein product [Lepeophtheirus salmonis]|uniref:(salmon louse) hypothetical protein n=1 Tax=Lepeophtheirus salmonis TaxID=72036 RepID=A0A7R8CL65_LEPSM|nr:unnamed protein product [Lepeophtheirus salmonis]CAF2825747.1 unnamed protein product [Lepeophtheirus salmonis]
MDSVGSWNKYQFFPNFIFCIIVIFFTYSHYLPILYLYVPEHHCLISGGEEWNLTQKDLKAIFIPIIKNESHYEKCIQYDVDVIEILEIGVRETNTSWPTIQCKNGWHYELDNYFNSVASEFDFVCDDSWKGPLTDTVYLLDSALGMLIYGWIGDHLGRYWTIMICNWSVCIFWDWVGIFTKLYCLYYHSFFYGDFYGDILNFFLCSNNRMGFATAICGVIMPSLFYALKDWRLVNHAMHAQMLLTFLLPFLIHESVRWLLERKKFTKASDILEKVAKFNGKELDKNIISELKSQESIESEESNKAVRKEVTSILELFKTPRLLFAISVFLEFPADIVIIFSMELLGRRWTTLISMVLSGIPMFVAAYFEAFGGDAVIIMVLSMIGRFCSSMGVNVVMQFKYEICPTDLRGRGSGLMLFVGALLSFIAPYIVYSSNIYSILPYIIVGTGGLTVGFLALTLPETAGIELSTNAKEGEEFGPQEADDGFLGDFFEQFPSTPFERVRYPKSYFNSLNFGKKPSPKRKTSYWNYEQPSLSEYYSNKNYSPYMDNKDQLIRSLPRRAHPYMYNDESKSVHGYRQRKLPVTDNPLYVSTLRPQFRSEPSFAHIPGPPYEHYYNNEAYELPSSNFWPNSLEGDLYDEEPSFIKSFEKRRKRKKHRRGKPSGFNTHSTRKPVTLHTTKSSLIVSTLPPRRTPAIKFLGTTPLNIVIRNRAHPLHVTTPLPLPQMKKTRPIRFEKLEELPNTSNLTQEINDLNDVQTKEQEEDESVTLKHVEKLLIALLDHQQNRSRIMAETLLLPPTTPVPIRGRRVHPFIRNIKRNPVVRGAFGVLNTKAKGLGNVFFPTRRPRANQMEEETKDVKMEEESSSDVETLEDIPTRLSGIRQKEKMTLICKYQRTLKDLCLYGSYGNSERVGKASYATTRHYLLNKTPMSKYLIELIIEYIQGWFFVHSVYRPPNELLRERRVLPYLIQELISLSW